MNWPSRKAQRVVGCIADDLTGATDLGATLAARGMRTVILIGSDVPDQLADGAEAIVVALKSRTTPVAHAVEESLAALRLLQRLGFSRFIFKYCSTFDSTAQGNIGPVAERLLDALGQDLTLICPAFPANGRTVDRGTLFVWGVPLDKTTMATHPLTPMRDSSVMRLLTAQVDGSIALMPLHEVRRGPDAVREQLASMAEQGIRYVVPDAIDDADLVTIGEGAHDLSLVTGSSAVALGFPSGFVPSGGQPLSGQGIKPDGDSLIISGSCSQATQRQCAAFSGLHPARAFNVAAHLGGDEQISATVEWVCGQRLGESVLVYSTAPPDEVADIQATFHRTEVGRTVEEALAEIAAGVVNRGRVRALAVAGGETAGAVVRRLGVRALAVGATIEPGVPWTFTLGQEPLALALKSGNFGSDHFFSTAFEALRN
jgi:uncharacterized protein YgbK (DUF1537 family)